MADKPNYDIKDPEIQKIMMEVFDAWMKGGLWSTLYHLNLIGTFDVNNFPKIKEKLESHKNEIIKGFIKSLKNYDRPVDAAAFIIQNIRRLRHIGFDWPEFTLFEKSFEADGFNFDDVDLNENNNKQLNETLQDPALLKALAKFQQNEIFEALLIIRARVMVLRSVSKFNGIEKDNILSLIGKYKANIIKFFLVKINSYDNKSMNLMKEYIDLLQQIGISWPELTILKTSLASDK